MLSATSTAWAGRSSTEDPKAVTAIFTGGWVATCDSRFAHNYDQPRKPRIPANPSGGHYDPEGQQMTI